MDFLKTHDFTKNMVDKEHESLSQRLTERRVAAGQALCTQGQAAAGLFLITEGTVRVTMRGSAGGEEVDIVELAAPTVVGEMEIISGEPSIATAIAKTEVVAYELSHDDFQQMVQTWDSAASKILRGSARMVVGRLAEANRRLMSAVDPSEHKELVLEAYEGMFSDPTAPGAG